MRALGSLWQLTLFRSRALLREPSALFWTFVFPLLSALLIGISFRDHTPPPLAVAVTDGPHADAISARLGASPGLMAERLPQTEALEALRRGQVALVLVPGEHPKLIVDPSQVDGRAARLATVDTLERMHGRVDQLEVEDSQVKAPGRRYLDFVLPGLLGFGLMSSAIWSVGGAIVQLRTGKLLQRLRTTPMKRGQFLFSFLIWRGLLALVEILFFLISVRLLFDVRSTGSLLAFTTVGLVGSLCFGGLSVLAGSRARNSATASGMMNLGSTLMVFLSGVFFSVTRFPAWLQEVVGLLPLTALNHGLRGVLLEGQGLLCLWKDLLVLGVWGVVPFALALRFFRWR